MRAKRVHRFSHFVVVDINYLSELRAGLFQNTEGIRENMNNWTGSPLEILHVGYYSFFSLPYIFLYFSYRLIFSFHSIKYIYILSVCVHNNCMGWFNA